MSRYQKLFDKLKQEKRGAFVPFVPVGDPNPELSLQIIQTLIDAGADALELGIPFSDPMADGPTIQNANIRAFQGGITVDKCFDILTNIRNHNANIPIGLLIYANLVFKNGIDNFYAKCAKAGVDSVLIADLPVEYAQEFIVSAEKHGIAPIFICPPNADDEVIKNIAKYGKAYTYLVSRSGVTGTENRANKPLTHLLKKLIEFGAPPAIQGFGISEPCQVNEVIKFGAAGAIAGSATVKIIEKNLDNPNNMLSELSTFVKNMKNATQHS
ncbi:tryptophan synthase subunit alpha [Gilliamella sp. ESL0441]|uniref:tryptophan synthase subunit alpha n=1 Tax=Gilliamella sp. ESL0441 TaxID=2704654 RepID=UPI001C6983AD|nr:tryptophan synthase subunit alpha [Gilliamella sp. ESL0441]QYN44770.1 tryptophan synthase subunit alpha [Gilliamella sp. ESL0441]